jgi:oligopeptide/dipeptide ABC transporter ATP-binding protein
LLSVILQPVISPKIWSPRLSLMDNLLNVEDLVKYYPQRSGVVPKTIGYVKAVDGVSFSIAEGKTLGLVGESGCGKTTVGRTVLRLLEPTSGRISFDGRDILRLSAREMRSLRREMQMVFQDPYGSLNPRMTIGQTIAEPLMAHGLRDGGRSRAAARARMLDLLDIVGLSRDHVNRYPHEFSGGQRQRVGIARALALEPKFIVCDEAVSSLDVSIQAQILNLLSDLQARFNLTYLFIAHDLSVVKHVSDRVAVMYLGQIVEEADTSEIFSRPLHPYTQGLLASIPSLSRRASRIHHRLEGDAAASAVLPPGCRFHPRCPIAIDECKREKPALMQIGEGHRVACIRTDVSETMIER